MITYIVEKEYHVTGRGFMLVIDISKNSICPMPGNQLTFRGKAYTISSIETSLKLIHPSILDSKVSICVTEIDKKDLKPEHHIFISDYVAKIMKTY